MCLVTHTPREKAQLLERDGKWILLCDEALLFHISFLLIQSAFTMCQNFWLHICIKMLLSPEQKTATQCWKRAKQPPKQRIQKGVRMIANKQRHLESIGGGRQLAARRRDLGWNTQPMQDWGSAQLLPWSQICSKLTFPFSSTWFWIFIFFFWCPFKQGALPYGNLQFHQLVVASYLPHKTKPVAPNIWK